MFIVLRVDDNGGRWYICIILYRHANISLLPNRQRVDEEVSTYKLEYPPETKSGSRVKKILENHKNLHTALLIVVLLGTCMVVGDGILTPAISAVSWLELSMTREHHEYAVVPITCFILVCLFALQHYGTHRVGSIFAPIIVAWLLYIILCTWSLQHHPLEPTCLSSPLAILYVQIFKEDKKGRLDVLGWHSVVHHRFRGNVC